MLQQFEEEKCAICEDLAYILSDPSYESLSRALENLLEDHAARARLLKHVTSLQLMFNDASRQPLLIPLDISIGPLSSTSSSALTVIIRN